MPPTRTTFRRDVGPNGWVTTSVVHRLGRIRPRCPRGRLLSLPSLTAPFRRRKAELVPLDLGSQRGQRIHPDGGAELQQVSHHVSYLVPHPVSGLGIVHHRRRLLRR